MENNNNLQMQEARQIEIGDKVNNGIEGYKSCRVVFFFIWFLESMFMMHPQTPC
jgi:hypothetical protein